MEDIKKILAEATNNFESGYYSTTLLGWEQKYDELGRPLNADPNYKSWALRIENKDYWFIRRFWTVRVWEIPANYMAFLNNRQDFILEIDLTPDYIK